MLEHAVNVLLDQLHEASEALSFKPLVSGIRKVLEAHQIYPSRIQMPMTKRSGFRHPMYRMVGVTWDKDTEFAETFVVGHSELFGGASRSVGLELDEVGAPPVSSPYRRLHDTGDACYRVRLTHDTLEYPLLEKLRSQGKVDYIVFSLQLPGNKYPQFMSVASDVPFPDDVETAISRLCGVFSLALYGAYRTSQAVQLSKAYVGYSTGPRVLQGAIARGAAETLHAGIMFCDVRGFTAMSERLDGRGVIEVINQLFQVVGEAAESRGGEILKFIGDAMLIVFRLDGIEESAVAAAMVDTVQESLEGVSHVSEQLGESLSVGFGSHIGEVVYGNIGTVRRLDFTVMGSAVNLASRLESLTKSVQADAVFSEAVAKHVPSLRGAGEHALKGVSKPVSAFVLDNR